MKICVISYHTCPLSDEEDPEFGGLNTYVLELSKALANRGIKVDIYTRNTDPKSPAVVNVCENLRVIHLKPDFLKGFYEFGELDYDLISAHYYSSGLKGLEIKNKLKIPLIVTFHTLALMKNLVARSEKKQEDIERIKAEFLLVQKADKIIATSEADLEYIHSLLDCPLSKISILTPGVDLATFKPIDKKLAKKKIGANPDHRIILFVGRITPLKGLDVLLYAIKIIVQKYPGLNFCLWIVGAGEKKKLEEIRKLLGITSQVKFVGKKVKEELPFYYNSAEVVIMPSQYESFGIAALEAIACGIPVITTDVTGISGLLDKEHSSFLTSANNPILLSKKIKYLLTHSKEKNKISRLLLEKVRDLSWETQAEKFLQIVSK